MRGARRLAHEVYHGHNARTNPEGYTRDSCTHDEQLGTDCGANPVAETQRVGRTSCSDEVRVLQRSSAALDPPFKYSKWHRYPRE
jgi:hypothetical protein